MAHRGQSRHRSCERVQRDDVCLSRRRPLFFCWRGGRCVHGSCVLPLSDSHAPLSPPLASTSLTPPCPLFLLLLPLPLPPSASPCLASLLPREKETRSAPPSPSLSHRGSTLGLSRLHEHLPLHEQRQGPVCERKEGLSVWCVCVRQRPDSHWCAAGLVRRTAVRLSDQHLTASHGCVKLCDRETAGAASSSIHPSPSTLSLHRAGALTLTRCVHTLTANTLATEALKRVNAAPREVDTSRLSSAVLEVGCALATAEWPRSVLQVWALPSKP